MDTRSDDRPVFRTRVEVRSYELDAFGHANHAVFLNYLEFARFQMLADAGFPYPALRERGLGIFVVRVEVDYLKEARLGDRLRIESWVEGYRRTSMSLRQRVTNPDLDHAELARARVVAVWVGPDRRPLRVPADLRAALGDSDEAHEGP